MTEKEKMSAGLVYDYTDPELAAAHARSVDLCERYNRTPRSEGEARGEILRALFGRAGKNLCVESNLRCDYGFNIEAGDDFFVNYDCVFLDCAKITFGNHVFIAPQCGFYTVNHVSDPLGRRQNREYARPIRVGNDVWLGGGVKVLPGVVIGDNVIVGAGSVVVRDIPPNSVAVGTPARVIKSLPPVGKERA